MANFYSKKVEEVLAELKTSLSGLSSQEAQKRLSEYGFNELQEKKEETLLQMFIDQFKDFMIVILIIAALVSAFVGEYTDAIVIVAIVVLNALLGVIQENRANKALKALKKMTKPNAKVIRDGKVQVVPTRELIPGDIVVLEAGDFVPADGRLIEVANLKINEASLTGESVPVEKRIDPIESEDVSIGDRINMVFTGTTVVYGRGKMVVVNTGMKTEMGNIASMMEEEKVITPLQERLAELGKTLAIICLAISALIFFIGYLRGTPLLEMFMTAISLAVAAIPEGLPAIVTITLAIGVQRMVKRNAIIRKLPAVETLGSANVICTDKTGTLTLNQMTVKSVYVNGQIEKIEDARENELSEKLMSFSALCSDAKIDENGNGIGDPTEVALVAALRDYGKEKAELEAALPRVDELPFDSERKLMTTVHKTDNGYLVITKGALESVMSICTSIEKDGKIRAIEPQDLEDIEESNNEMAHNGMRVLALAYKILPERYEKKELESKLTFLGLIGMIDPPRPEVKDAVKECELAGITTVMITGDHKLTAEAIARDIGILHEGEEIVTGRELENMNDEELAEKVKKIRVYARVSPEHKVRIVKAWQKNDAVVCMTGDGVNDAPALSQADIGTAMGITGTEVAKEASAMILTDDNFATIVAAVEEGRTIYANIRKSIRYLLSCNFGEIITVLLANIFGLGQPLLPIHLLWINLVTDSLPALGLGMEPPSHDVMKAKPRSRNESIFAGGLGIQMIIEGIVMGLLAITAFHIGIDYGIETAETMTFMTLVFSQLIHSLNSRSTKESLFKLGLGTNKFLIMSIVIGFGLQILLDTPLLNGIFKISTLNAVQWLYVVGLSLVILLVGEVEKLISRMRS